MELRVIYVLTAREFKKFIRERTRIITTVARPLLWLLLVGAGMSKLISPKSGMPYTQFIFPGILGMTILFSSIFSSISIIWDKEFGFFKEILVAPVSRVSIVIGKGLSGTVVSTLQAALVLLFFPLLGFRLGPLQIVEVILIAVAMSFCISTFGIILATFFEGYQSFSVIMNFIIMPMFFLSGAMYPVKLLPKALAFLALLNPLSYGVDAFKNVIFPLEEGPMSPDFSLLTDVSVIVGLTVLFVVVGSVRFERKS